MNTNSKPRHFVFLLLGEFSQACFTCALEALRQGNRAVGYDAYTWAIAAEGGDMMSGSNGIEMKLHMGLDEVNRDDTIVVCGGLNIAQNTTKPIINWLRRESRKGVAIAGISTGSYTLAKAGLLDGRRCTIHWENHDSFEEDFPEVELLKTVYVIDGNRMSCAGGTSSIDLFLKIIADDHGQDAANWVSDQLIYNSPRTEKDGQRLSIPTRIGVRHPKLAEVIKMMEENIEEPISPSILAKDVGMSTRQLERLFRRYLDRSPKRYYMELRLQKARNLLMQTGMTVINVALACGFASPSHFSKCYRAQYNTTPYRERGSQMSGDS
ncbi:AraC family transcriptional regulator [Amylibacter kogurei]|uniref:AraC family transcriptional regulator n=1 Tax=Paramylibacter kogurei TaxID=1889778 RepID=A0A2G5K9F7_9RHOB|nr:GlxA family transcriptional regulator [Amylibacter kogurei]PIB26178.1 AraC family transcriptional regulator [Amylibacter kogurei]